MDIVLMSSLFSVMWPIVFRELTFEEYFNAGVIKSKRRRLMSGAIADYTKANTIWIRNRQKPTTIVVSLRTLIKDAVGAISRLYESDRTRAQIRSRLYNVAILK